MPESAFAVHGLSEEFLYKQPVFGEIVDSSYSLDSSFGIKTVTVGCISGGVCADLLPLPMKTLSLLTAVPAPPDRVPMKILQQLEVTS